MGSHHGLTRLPPKYFSPFLLLLSSCRLWLPRTYTFADQLLYLPPAFLPQASPRCFWLAQGTTSLPCSNLTSSLARHPKLPASFSVLLQPPDTGTCSSHLFSDCFLCLKHPSPPQTSSSSRTAQVMSLGSFPSKGISIAFCLTTVDVLTL